MLLYVRSSFNIRTCTKEELKHLLQGNLTVHLMWEKKTALTMKMLCQLGKGLQMQQFLPLKKKGDCRKLFKSSGNYALTVSHKLDTKNTSVKLPSGSK